MNFSPLQKVSLTKKKKKKFVPKRELKQLLSPDLEVVFMQRKFVPCPSVLNRLRGSVWPEDLFGLFQAERRRNSRWIPYEFKWIWFAERGGSRQRIWRKLNFVPSFEIFRRRTCHCKKKMEDWSPLCIYIYIHTHVFQMMERWGKITVKNAAVWKVESIALG